MYNCQCGRSCHHDDTHGRCRTGHYVCTCGDDVSNNTSSCQNSSGGYTGEHGWLVAFISFAATILLLLDILLIPSHFLLAIVFPFVIMWVYFNLVKDL